MIKPFTIATPQYAIESIKGDHFNIFSKRNNAIKNCIKMATEFPGATFVVIKKTFNKRKLIFSFKLEIQSDFEDVQTIYSSLTEVYQKKLDKTKYWRKSNGFGD